MREWLDRQTKPHLTTAEILQDCIGLDGAHMQQAHMNRLGPIMHALGWENKRVSVEKRGGGRRQVRAWVSMDKQKELEEVPL
ncbi:hypothetical protein [Thiohalophilus sp.]|uniref:hypothetical protein n=1 Tax=Thiohalophilus sp. TaxID=3028392 RepID=UPI002ACDD0E1|nr:hypothetical protein [Thiohalophilus sp.]MDZ7804316.1 hypothetical protein [Thiohalophilus sp.]